MHITVADILLGGWHMLADLIITVTLWYWCYYLYLWDERTQPRLDEISFPRTDREGIWTQVCVILKPAPFSLQSPGRLPQKQQENNLKEMQNPSLESYPGPTSSINCCQHVGTYYTTRSSDQLPLMPQPWLQTGNQCQRKLKFKKADDHACILC